MGESLNPELPMPDRLDEYVASSLGRDVTVFHSIDALNAEAWDFWPKDGVLLVLDGYRRLAKTTRRHKWRVTQCWSRLYERDATMKAEAIPRPKYVGIAAIAYQQKSVTLEENWTDA